MIALLSCSISSLGRIDRCISSTGGADSTITSKDSALISYDDLRIVNGKLVELKYVKEENIKLKDIVKTDSIIIVEQTAVAGQMRNENKRLKRQRNLAGGTAIGAILLLIISLVK